MPHRIPQATVSVPSPVINLHAIDPSLTRESVIEAIIDRWRKWPRASIQSVDPLDESIFPGIGDLQIDLQSWNWIFGKTPKFSVEKKFSIDSVNDDAIAASFHVVVNLDKGRITSVSVRLIGDENSSAESIIESCQFLEDRLNETLTNVEFRAQIVSLYLAKLADELMTSSPIVRLGTGSHSTDAEVIKLIVMTVFDNIADMCLQ